MRLAIAVAVLGVLLAACLDTEDPAPTCAELGCPEAPSGSGDEWAPCDGDRCFCRVDDGAHDPIVLECRP